MFALKGVAARGAASADPCSFSIMTLCFPNGTSSSSSPTPLVPWTTGTSDRKSRSSDDNEREPLPAVDFGREKRLKNLETADCAGPSVVGVESTGLATVSAEVNETGEAAFVDEAETEAVSTGGTGGGFVSRLLETDGDPGPATLCPGDWEAVLDGAIGGVSVSSAIDVGLVGNESVVECCKMGALVSGMLGRLVEPSRRFQKEENKPDFFLVSTDVSISSFFSTIRHPTGMSSGTSSDRFLTAVSQSNDDPLLRMKCAIGLNRVMGECLVRRNDLFISLATADLANGTLGVKGCSRRRVSRREFLTRQRVETGAR